MTGNRILAFTKKYMQERIQIGDVVIDATVGRGNDTLFLANLVGLSGHVYGFDIQQEAIDSTSSLLIGSNLSSRVTLYQQGHHLVNDCLPDHVKGNIKAAIFNLGYLPGGNKAITTNGETTIDAVTSILQLLSPTGFILLVVYLGHEEGKVESQLIDDFCKTLSPTTYDVFRYEYMNKQNNPPYVLIIQKMNQ